MTREQGLYTPDWLKQAANKLATAGFEHPWREARRLAAHALAFTYEEVLFGTLTPQAPPHFEIFVQRRCQGEPLSKIRGIREFWGLDFEVTPHTLDPRPDTETLIEAVLESYPDRTVPYKILDLGTGTGCILIALLKEFPQATGTGVDISAEALAVAQRNGQRHLTPGRVCWVQSYWGSALNTTFDIIVSNPPYIAEDESLPVSVRDYDPPLALFAGQDGLNAFREIFLHLPHLCHPGSRVFLEMGDQQAPALTRLIKTYVKNPITCKPDLGKTKRIASFAYRL